MNEEYKSLTLEILYFDDDDVIVTSPTDNTGGNGANTPEIDVPIGG